MIASQDQNRMHDVAPTSGTSHSFQDIPLTPPHNRGQSSNTSTGLSHMPQHNRVQSSNTSTRLSHMPLDHEVIASRSAWDDSPASDEVKDQWCTFSKGLSEQGSRAATTSNSSDSSLTAVGDQAECPSNTSGVKAQKVPGSTSDVSNPCSQSAWAPDSRTPRTVSALTLVETERARETKYRPAVALNKVSPTTKVPRDQIPSPAISECDITDARSKSRDHANSSWRPAEISTSIPSAKVVAHTAFSRAGRPEPSPPSSNSELFKIPIPIFPFPPGTSRCTDRKCPIKHRHEKGPYLHEGKLRSRRGSIFGSSNPPPEIWLLYDTLREQDLHGTGDKAFAPVELFAKFHFGETRGEYVGGSDGVGKGVQEGGKEQEGKKSRFWRFWG